MVSSSPSAYSPPGRASRIVPHAAQETQISVILEIEKCKVDSTSEKMHAVEKESSSEGYLASDSPLKLTVFDIRQSSVEEQLPGGLQRRLGNRQLQLLAIGGSIGNALFISVGSGLARGGPGSLFLAYIIHSIFLGLINN